MQFEELTCGLCQRQYSNQGDLIPRLLPECGHTYCTSCLNTLLSQSSGEFFCPEDKQVRERFSRNFQQSISNVILYHQISIIITQYYSTHCIRKSSAEEYPKNFALLRLAEKTLLKAKQQQMELLQQQQQQQLLQAQQEAALQSQMLANQLQQMNLKDNHQSQHHTNYQQSHSHSGNHYGYQQQQQQQQMQTQEEELCRQHQRKLEIICIDDRERICSSCALFGNHKNHDIRMESDVLNEIEVRTECLMEMYQMVESNQLCKVDQNQVEQLSLQFRAKSQELRQLVTTKFKELKASLKIQEQQTEQILKRNLTHIENNFQIIKDVPQRLFDDAEKWLKNAKIQLDNFMIQSQNPNYIAFDMLENKLQKMYTSEPDIISQGEKILIQLDGQKDVSVQKIESMITQLNVTFDPSAIKMINEVCKCDLVEGVQNSIDDIIDDKSNIKLSNNIGQNKPSTNSYSSTNITTNLNQKKNGVFDDEQDLLSDMTFPTIDNMSPMKQTTKLQHEPLKKQSTVVHQKAIPISSQSSTNVQILHQPQQQKQMINLPTSDDSLMQTSQTTANTTAQSDVKEDLDEDLINEIENYLKDVMENNEKVIDISETQIGNYGAKCVAAVLSLCEGLEEIRLSSCGIKDDGALELFDELKVCSSVVVLDLSNNSLTEKCFDGLNQLLQVNKRIERVELKGINVKNKFQLNKIKNVMNRVII